MVAEIGHLPRMLQEVPAAPVISPPITVLMATRNGAAYLPQQLASLSAQTDQNWQLWASDDGSSDGTMDILAAFGAHHPVRLLRGPCKGAAANFLSLLLHPDLPAGPVAFADQDDVWLPEKLARARDWLCCMPSEKPALYGAESLVVAANLTPLFSLRVPKAAPSFGNALVENLFSGHTMVLNAAAVALARRAGMPQDIRFHDWWLYQLVAGAGGVLHLDPTVVALYRQHAGNLIGAARGPVAATSRLLSLVRGHWHGTIRRHALALQRSPGQTPAAQSLLATYLSDLPVAGPFRVRSIHRLGLRRSRARDRLAFQICAFFGRV